MSKNFKNLLFIIVLVFFALVFAVPENFIYKPNLSLFGQEINLSPPLKRGLDIQGGMQVILKTQMDEIAEEDKDDALESAREIINKRVDLYGISEPVVQTSLVGEERRIIVELPGVTDPEEALDLVGRTAQLDFRLQIESDNPEATVSALSFINNFEKTELTGKQLKKASVQFDQQTSEPVISLEFDEQGRELFADITRNHVGEMLAIFIDDLPIATPTISTEILDGRAVMTGGFDVDTAKQLAVQLNAGALPITIEVLQQRTIGASLGEISIQKSVRAGLIGLGLVMLFMILYYGVQGVVASLALIIYSVLTMAIYKIFGVVLTLPGIAGLLLSIGMAVDANILIFERMKEELRVGQNHERALELGFGRAWDSIKDANLATIMTALVLINPLEFSFLNTSGLVRGFGITLLIGVLISLFTGVVVSRTLLRIILPIFKDLEKQT
jgi:preprotein translocase subunit SecD